jgi:hypothetical protein
MRRQAQNEGKTGLFNFQAHDPLYTIQLQYNRLKLRRLCCHLMLPVSLWLRKKATRESVMACDTFISIP